MSLRGLVKMFLRGFVEKINTEEYSRVIIYYKMPKKKTIAVYLVIAGFIAVGAFLAFSSETTITLIRNDMRNVVSEAALPVYAKRLEKPPHPIKGIYISAWTANQSQKIKDLIQLINETELNGVVVDIKDATGFTTYKVEVPLVESIGANDEPKIPDIDDFVNLFHRNNIYVIGRVQVFQDPILAKARPDVAIKDSKTGKLWEDKKGLEWLDPSSRVAWQYAADIARDMAKHGFDEVNFDYVRFPSDGIIENLDFPFWDASRPKYELVGSFFSYLSQELKDVGIAKSADIFGLTSWRAFDFNFDLNIGQRLLDALPYFDYVSPMVYPSHFPANFNGIKNPATKPYEIVFGSLKIAQDLIATSSYKTILRPWLQDFSLGGVDYDKTKIRAQIQATYDAGIDSWLLWNSSSRYTKDALLP